jgi:type I restriction enzyme S subunit
LTLLYRILNSDMAANLAPAGMDEATAALFPDMFDGSRGRPVPWGWSEASLYESPGVHTPEATGRGTSSRPAISWSAWMANSGLASGDRPAAFLRSTIEPQLAHNEATEAATSVIHLGKGNSVRFVGLLPPVAVMSAIA